MPEPTTTALAADGPRVRMCPECRVDKHHNCTRVAFDADDREVPCPCRTCTPAPRQLCTSCGKPINPVTAECSGCSD